VSVSILLYATVSHTEKFRNHRVSGLLGEDEILNVLC
jgi:hypothetical protein